MIDYIKVSWKWWNEENIIQDNQFEIFHSHEEANAFIEKLKNTSGMIHIHKTTCEFFKIK
jgi:hypothetical protein